MNILPLFFRSLLLASVFSFAAPVLFVGAMLASLFLIGYVPGLAILGHCGVQSVWQFLMTFGSGSPLEGILAIATTCAVVGVMFDTCAFYRYQTLRGE
jgi:hypothetical protein